MVQPIGSKLGGLDFRQEPHVEIFLANGRSLIIPLTMKEKEIVAGLDLEATLMFVDHILAEGFNNSVTRSSGEFCRKSLH